MSFQSIVEQATTPPTLEKSPLFGLFLCAGSLLCLSLLSVISQWHSVHLTADLCNWAGLTLCTPVLYIMLLPFLRAWLSKKAFPFTTHIPLTLILFCGYFYSLLNTLKLTENETTYFDYILLVLLITNTCEYLQAHCQYQIDCLLYHTQTEPILPQPLTPVVKKARLSEDHLLDAKLHALEKKESAMAHTGNVALWHVLITFTVSAAIFFWWLPFDYAFSLFCGISSLLLTCPCTIAIVYPMTIACAIEVGAKKGIFIKNPLPFLKFSQVEHVIFDKKEALTKNMLRVTRLEYLCDTAPSMLLPMIELLEKKTAHPITKAVMQYLHGKIDFPALASHDVTQLRVFQEEGLYALIQNKHLFIGPTGWLRKKGLFIPFEASTKSNEELHNHIMVHCMINGKALARIHLKDILSQDMLDMSNFLQHTHIDTTIFNHNQPKHFSADRFYETSTPPAHTKEEQVLLLQNQNLITAMIGNDSSDILALQRADIGIATNSNAPIKFYADVVLHDSQLCLIKALFCLSEKTKQILKQNYWIALGFNACLLPVAGLGALPSSLMLLSLALSTLLIMGNTIRLKSALI